MQRASTLFPLTSLRFFAAAAIVVGHILPSVADVSGDSRYGLGVGFFFVLSGFILTYQYRDFSDHSIKAFYIARIARLWPLHLLTFLFAALVLQPEALLSPLHSMTALINVMMLHAWLPIRGLVFSWNAPSWSISDELWFYLLLPFLARSTRLLAWLVILTAIAAFIVLYFPLTPVKPFEFAHVHAIMQHPAVRIVEFAAGVVAGRLYNAGYRIRFEANILEILALALVAAFAFTSPMIARAIATAWSPSVGLWYNQSGGFAVFAVAIFIFAQGGGAISRALSWRWFVLLGEISFSTYMMHQLVMRFARLHGWPQVLGTPAAVVLVLVIIYLGSYILWRFFEIPARRWVISLLASDPKRSHRRHVGLDRGNLHDA